MVHKVSLSNKVFTENPLLDEIVYNARQLATGVIIKDNDAADLNETVDSIQEGDILVAIYNGTIRFENFIYDREALLNYYGIIEEELIREYMISPSKIPKEDRDGLLNNAVKAFLENFEEENSYYRMLAGLPTYKFNNKGVIIWDGFYIDESAIDDFNPTPLSFISPYPMEGYTPFTKLNLVQKNVLFENGTCESIMDASDWLASYELTKKDAMYLMHIGDREIAPQDARRAEDFSLMYCPACDAEEVRNRFKDLYEANRLYMFYTYYSKAYKFRSDYYNNFMRIFLIIQTVIDMMIELPEYIIRRDIFDTRTCKYIFESNGVKYFKDIPLKYQITLVKNLNKLIKFKSTDKCIVDIVSLFGMDNIEVFRYYIMKDRRVNSIDKLDYYDNRYEVTDTLGNKKIKEDTEENYDIRFIKVPILDKYDEYIRKDANIKTYETMIEGDATWIGDKEYDTVWRDIKDLDFTVLRSKYYSIEAVIDLAKRNFTLVYFMNLLMNNKIDKSRLVVNLPIVSNIKKFELVDTIIALFSLSYIYYGVEDTIMDSRSKVARILGFNLEADLGKISSWLAENNQGLTLKDMQVDFQVAEGGKIMSFKQLENIFMKNSDCYRHIHEVMLDPPSKEIYDAYKFLDKSLLTMNMNMEYFIIGSRDIVDQYKKDGYNTKFIDIPDQYSYNNPDDYDRDYRWLVESIDDKDLCFAIDRNFDVNHKLDLYVKKDNKLECIGQTQMAYTYKEFLRYKDVKLYSFINKTLSIPNMDVRRESCVNAIQAITSYLKDYIDRDVVELDTVFSGLPSISMDFIKRYVEEVIDFFKSFKIFTHGSSIIYTITDKFDNYVQLIDHILLKYLFDKSELVKIEDAIGGKVEEINGKLYKAGNGITSLLTDQEKINMIDKVWLDISTWIQKNFVDSFRYNDENDKKKVNEILGEAKKVDDRIKDLKEYVSKYTLSSDAYHGHLNKKIGSPTKFVLTVDAIVKFLVYMTLNEQVIYKDKVHLDHTYELNTHYERWITDIASLLISKTVSDKMRYQDDYIRKDVYDIYTVYTILDITSHGTNMEARTDIGMHDDIYSIITQEFPEHKFDE